MIQNTRTIQKRIIKTNTKKAKTWNEYEKIKTLEILKKRLPKIIQIAIPIVAIFHLQNILKNYIEKREN